jgi:hypothetical protein
MEGESEWPPNARKKAGAVRRGGRPYEPRYGVSVDSREEL